MNLKIGKAGKYSLSQEYMEEIPVLFHMDYDHS
jgi:hypothetical protein